MDGFVSESEMPFDVRANVVKLTYLAESLKSIQKLIPLRQYLPRSQSGFVIDGSGFYYKIDVREHFLAADLHFARVG